jgi:two-component system response regulator ChvI
VATAAPLPIALVDDDPLYCEAVAGDLGDRGFAVRPFPDGESLLAALHGGLDVRLVLIDWVLPTMSGLDLVRRLRQGGVDLPIVGLTGRSLVEREIEAFDAGAVDFIAKERGIDVLVHRLRLLVDLEAARGARRPEPIRRGPLQLRLDAAQAEWHGRDVGLTVTEFKVLVFLVSYAGTFLTYRALYDEVRFSGLATGDGRQGFAVNVRAMIKRMRAKFRAVDPQFAHIVTRQGVGYCWRLELPEASPPRSGSPAGTR